MVFLFVCRLDDGFAFALEIAFDLAFDKGGDGFETRGEEGTELIGFRMFGFDFAELTGEGDAEVGADIDLADASLAGFFEHRFGDADRGRHVAAVFVDEGERILRDGAGAVEDEREARELGFDFIEDVEAEGGFGSRLELVSAVGGADGDG